MKVYRKSIVRQFHLWLFSFCLLGLLYTEITIGIPFLAFLALFILFGGGLLYVARFWCYLIISDNELIIRNSFYWFWNKKYAYKDISKIYFSGDTNMHHGPYFRIESFSLNRACRYLIEGVKSTDYLTIVNELRSKGVVIEISESLKKNYTQKR